MGIRRWLVFGAIVMVAAVGTGILIATLLGFAGLSDEPEKLPEMPALGADEPQYPRSAAADILASVSFEEMTQEQIDLVKTEVTKAFDNAEFRATSPLVMGLDVVRRDGHTRAVHQYRPVDAPGGGLMLAETIIFFCPGPEGFVDIFRADFSPLMGNVRGERKPEGTQPLDREISALDWTQRKDLGFDEFQGHRIHGVEMPFRAIESDSTLPWQLWFDVETAQLRVRREVPSDNNDNFRYEFDWHAIPKIEPTEALGKPPCYDDIYPEG